MSSKKPDKATSNQAPEAMVGPTAKDLGSSLKKSIIGQDEAIMAIVDIYRLQKAGFLPEGRPIGNFLFLGPTGTGKTKTVEALAKILHGSEKHVLKVDCGEFQMEHEVAKLIGSPPGYLGHRETQAVLTQQRLNAVTSDLSSLSLVLFDEIEKAAPSMTRLLLGILDKGILRLGDNSLVNFEKSLIFLTSNLGTREMLKPEIGFTAKAINDEETESQDKIKKRNVQCAITAVNKKFSPEFINRIDIIVVFNFFGSKELEEILELELKFEQELIDASKKHITLIYTDAAKELILREGFNKKYNARFLKRAIKRLVLLPLSKLVEDSNFSESEIKNLWVDCKPETDKLIFSNSDPSLCLKKTNGA